MSTINPKIYADFLPKTHSRTLKDRLSLANIQQYTLKVYRKITKPKIVDIEGIKLFVSDNLESNVLRTIHQGIYEKSELQIVKKQIESDDTVMELGTGLGLISSYCAKKIGSERVFTYEANPQLKTYIESNYQLNNVNPNLVMCMLGEKPGKQDFYLNKDFWASSTLPINQEYQVISIPVKSFNEEIFKINPTFLIIDIEGGEYELLKSANLYNVKKICLELHNDVLGEEKTNFILSKFADLGFVIDQNLSLSRELFLKR